MQHGLLNDLSTSVKLRFVLISDTHLQEPVLPKGEVLIHAGDLTASGSRRETERAMRWLGNVARNFEWVVFVGGNHDFFFYHLSREMGVNAVREFVRPYGENIIYLEDELTTVAGARIYGSPAQPEFCDWAWNYARGAEIKAVWDKIPSECGHAYYPWSAVSCTRLGWQGAGRMSRPT